MFAMYLKHVYDIYVYQHTEALLLCFTYKKLRHEGFMQTGLTLIPAWISNYIDYKVWDELLIYSQTSMVAPLKFGNGISNFK